MASRSAGRALPDRWDRPDAATGPLEVAPASLPLLTGGRSASASGDSDGAGGELAYTGTELTLPVLMALFTLILVLVLVRGLGLTVAPCRRLAGTVL